MEHTPGRFEGWFRYSYSSLFLYAKVEATPVRDQLMPVLAFTLLFQTAGSYEAFLTRYAGTTGEVVCVEPLVSEPFP